MPREPSPRDAGTRQRSVPAERRALRLRRRSPGLGWAVIVALVALPAGSAIGQTSLDHTVEHTAQVTDLLSDGEPASATAEALGPTTISPPPSSSASDVAASGALGVAPGRISTEPGGGGAPERTDAADTTGPYDLHGELVEADVVSHDGTVLHGWIGRPDVPDGMTVPTVLVSTPYLEFCRSDILIYQAQNDDLEHHGCTAAPSADEWRTDGLGLWVDTGLPAMAFIERGYAVALFSVRGTGRSGGCFELMGPDEQDDAAILVDWLAEQDWSNGNVAMFGRSYPSSGAFSAAIDRPQALKAIVVTGLFTDLYTWQATPQGAASLYTGPFWTEFTAGVSVAPAVTQAANAPVAPERVCEDVLDAVVAANVAYVDERDEEFYAARRLIDDFHRIETPVLITQGFDDYQGGSAHRFQESAVWQALPNAPKRQIEGQWGHYYPDDAHATLDPRWRNDRWETIAFDWLDHYLKDGPQRPERLGFVDYQDSSGVWHHSRRWPPTAAENEVLYLADGTLAAEPGGTDRTFHHALDAFQSEIYPHEPALCPDPLPDDPAPHGIAYTATFPEDVVLAGNPFAYLNLTSDRPGGLVAVTVWELTPEFDCSAVPGFNQWAEDASMPGLGLISSGAADLRFHQGNFDGRDFPVREVTPVRIDLVNLAERIEAGHRLAIVVSSGGATDYESQPYRPQITVHAGKGAHASHVVLPVTVGTTGGDNPTIDYPPRPFVP